VNLKVTKTEHSKESFNNKKATRLSGFLVL